MFLVYGIRRKALIGEAIPGACMKCGTEGSMQVLIVQPYAHIFWLPLFPLPKRGRWHCMACSDEVKGSDMPDQVREIVPLIKEKARTPWWMFIGSMLLAAPLFHFVHWVQEHERQQADFLAHPQVGDVWTIELGHKHYTLQRVEEVREDSVFLLANELEVRGAGAVGLSKFQKEAVGSFSADRIGYARVEIKKMDREGILRSVARPKR